MKKLVFTFALLPALAFGQQAQVNPATQIRWPAVTGPTAPATGCPITTTASTTLGSPVITVASGGLGLAQAQTVSGAGVPVGATVVSVYGTTVTLSAAATATGSGIALDFYPYGMPYTDTLHNVQYVCSSAGWVTSASSTMTWPATAGVANYAGSNAWGTSYQVGTTASDLVQLNSSGYLPALNASLLTAYPYASLTGAPLIPTVGTWGALNYPAWASGTPFVKMTAAGTFALDTNTYLTGITSSQVTTALGFTPYNATNPAGYITDTIATLPDLALPYSQLSGTPTLGTFAAQNYATPPAIGATTPNTGAFTAVTATSYNGVALTTADPSTAYLNGAGAYTTPGGGLPSVQVENVFTGPGTINFQHNLNDEYPLYSCFSLSGASAYTATPVDANNMAITVSAAATILCAFQKTAGINFFFTATPASTIYNPTMGGTQTPTFAIAQTVVSGYSGTVTYSATGLAAGMTGSYSPTTITGNGSSTLTVSFPATQTPGLTSFTASGTDGTNTSTYPVSLTVSGINTNLVDGWPMNDGSGTSFLAGPATSNTQTFSSSIGTWGTHAGFPGTSFAFNGTGFSTGTNNTNTNFSGTTPFSLCTWVNLPVVSVSQAFATNITSGNVGWQFLIYGSPAGYPGLYIESSVSNRIIVQGQTGVPPGALSFVCTTYDGSQHASGVLFYLNGTVMVSNTESDTLTASAANSQPVTLGGSSTGIFLLTGTEGYVRIYNAVLTPTQVSALYAAGPR